MGWLIEFIFRYFSPPSLCVCVYICEGWDPAVELVDLVSVDLGAKDYYCLYR